MAGKAQSIKASEAYVTIRADEGNLPNTIESARARMKTFAGQSGMLGEKIGAKLGDSIAKGAIAFAAVSALDGLFRDLAKELEAQATAGDFDFGGVAVAVGKSIKDSFESIPLIGSLVPLSEQIWDYLLGSPMAQERRLQQLEKEREKVQDFFNDIEKQAAAYENERLAGGDPSIAARQRADAQVADAIARAAEAGVPLESARKAAASITESFQRMMAEKADDGIARINEQLDDMAGKLPAGERELRAFEKQLESLRHTLEESGMDTGAVGAITDDLRQRFRAIQAEQAAAKIAAENSQREEDRLKRIGVVIDGLKQKLLEANLDESMMIRVDLEGLGATEAQIEEAMSLLDAMDKLKQEQREAEAEQSRIRDIESLLSDLQEASDRKTLGDRGYLEQQLRDLNATEAQVERALGLFDMVNEGSVERSFVGTFSSAALEIGGGQFTSLEGSSRETARNTRRIAEAVERNKITYGS